VGESLRFVNHFGFHDFAHFFLYQSPVFLVDPVLYLDTLLYLRQRGHQLWAAVVGAAKLADAFFYHYRAFVAPLRAASGRRFWLHRFLLTEVLADLMCDVFPARPEISALALAFVDLALPLLAAPAEFSAAIFRSILAVLALIARSVPRDQLELRVSRMIAALDRSQSPLFLMALRFALRLRPAVLRHGEVIKMVAARGMRSLVDFDVLAAVADPAHAIAVSTICARFAVSSKVYGRASFAELGELLLQLGRQSDVHDWFLILLRRLFAFLPLAYGKRKYQRRSLVIMEALAELAHAGPPWVQQAIPGMASAVGVRAVPPCFRCFFCITPSVVDEFCAHEIELLANAQLHLKTFPFDRHRNALVMLPLKEVSAVVPRVRVSGSLAHVEKKVLLSPRSIVKKRAAKAKQKAGEPMAIARPNQQPKHRLLTAPSGRRLDDGKRAAVISP
jgi:hypothetical protein